jgi:AmiR/NasT family two-component response regulator
MRSSRVVMALESRLLRGILCRAIGNAPGLQVVGEVADIAALASTVEATDAGWVVVPMWPDDRLPEGLMHLVATHPAVCLLGMAADGSQAKIRCAGSPEKVLKGLSLDDLIATLHNQES